MAFDQYWRAIFEIWPNYRFAVNIAEIVSKINSYVRFGAILRLSWVFWLYSHGCKMKLIETPKVQTPGRSNHPRKWAGYQEAEISGSITYILYIQRVRRVRLSFLTLRGLSPPIQLKGCSVPPHDCIGLNNQKRTAPTRPDSWQNHPKQPVTALKVRAFLLALEYDELLTKSEVLGSQGCD